MSRMTRTAYGLDTDRADDWRHRARCRNHPDPSLWVIEPGSRPRNAKAVAICNACPVRAQCLADGLEGKVTGMVFGGQRFQIAPRKPAKAADR